MLTLGAGALAVMRSRVVRNLYLTAKVWCKRMTRDGAGGNVAQMMWQLMGKSSGNPLLKVQTSYQQGLWMTGVRDKRRQAKALLGSDAVGLHILQDLADQHQDPEWASCVDQIGRMKRDTMRPELAHIHYPAPPRPFPRAMGSQQDRLKHLESTSTYTGGMPHSSCFLACSGPGTCAHRLSWLKSDSSDPAASSPLRRRGGLRGNVNMNDENVGASRRLLLAGGEMDGMGFQGVGDGNGSLVHQIYQQINPSGPTGGKAHGGEDAALKSQQVGVGLKPRHWVPAKALREQMQGRLKDQTAIVESVLSGEGGGGGERVSSMPLHFGRKCLGANLSV